MPLHNTARHYGAVTKVFHWLTALLVLTLIPLGIYANGLPWESAGELTRKAWFFSLHKTLGVTVFFVAVARILWALSQPKPALLHPDRKAESLAAETVHWLLYGSLVLVPLSGWVHHAATEGFAPIWWPLGQNLPLVPKSEPLAAASAGLHIVFERVLAASVFLHFAGALKHHFLDRDNTLRRMLPGRPEVRDTGATHRIALPVITATGIWVAALITGSALGLYESHATRPEAATLEAVASDWQVQEGTLGITVRQLNSDVKGSFEKWTAAILFDETITEGIAGSVDVTISVGSLTLGSVSGQALGSDFFDAENFPTAKFSADIFAGPDGYSARGTVTIKDQSVPVTLPFSLNLSGDDAEIRGSTALDRRSFAIGDGQKDEASLGFEVAVTVALTARRTSGR